MKLLHTSDWHLGIKLKTYDYLPSQREFADWLLKTVKIEKIDVVLVAGDIFDKGFPPIEAIELANEIFNQLCALDISVVIISGNHDSAERLNFCSQMMESAGLYIRTEQRNLNEVGEPIKIERRGESVCIIPIPYLDPTRVIEIGDAERSHGGLIDAILKSRLKEVADPAKTIVMSHAFVAGGTESDSEKSISIGGTARVAIDVYKKFGYVALGHLHKPQEISQNIFYSGTPLQYSFSEEHPKSVRVITIDETIKTHEIKIPIGPRVFTLKDSFENLLKDPKYVTAESHLVRIKLTDKKLLLNARARLEVRFSNLIDFGYVETNVGGEYSGSTFDLVRLTPDEIIRQYIEAVHPNVIEPDIDVFIKESVQIATAAGKE